jgi:hypothetical protein
MSRSIKKSPHFSYTKGLKGSDKLDKQLVHRAFRAKSNVAIRKDDFDTLPIKLAEGRNIYDFVSDGPKKYLKDLAAKWMRK